MFVKRNTKCLVEVLAEVLAVFYINSCMYCTYMLHTYVHPYVCVLCSHRDTTVQTLTLQSSVKDGQIIYEDSPLVSEGESGEGWVL